MSKQTIISTVVLSIILWSGISPLFAQKESKIKLLGANEMVYEEAKYGKNRILNGNVRFKHNKTLMYCDSAVLSASTNSMKAYGNIRIIEKENKTEMTGDSLQYNGDEKKGQLRGAIKLIQENQVLTTRHLDFDTKNKLAYYYGGGVITNQKDQSVLKSKIGYFHSDTKVYFFKDSVSYITEDYQIYSDTLEYNTVKDIVYFHGPTDIISDSNSIYCLSGFYDKQNEFSTFSQNVVMNTTEQTMTADSVVYFQLLKLGESFGNVVILDTLNNMEIKGDYAKYNNEKRTSLVTGSLELIMAFTEDSLHLHSDTLYTDYDSTDTHRLIHAFHHVQFFKPDLQGKCDSLSFSEADSTIRMYINPIVWSDSNQITGKEIIIKTYDGIIDNMQINADAFIISEEDTALYNQIKGKSLFAHFKDNEIYRIDVNRSGQTIYYVREDNGDLMGMNKLDCSNMSVFLDDNGVNHIKFYNQPDGIFLPMDKITKELKLLRYFYWRIDERPNDVEDIFNWTDVPDKVIRKRQSN